MSTGMKHKRIDVNVLVGDLPESDKELFFGPLSDEDVWVELPADARWPDIMAAARAFPSKSQARKNGWDKDVEPGFTEVTIGKLKNRVTVLKEFKDEDD